MRGINVPSSSTAAAEGVTQGSYVLPSFRPDALGTRSARIICAVLSLSTSLAVTHA